MAGVLPLELDTIIGLACDIGAKVRAKIHVTPHSWLILTNALSVA